MTRPILLCKVSTLLAPCGLLLVLASGCTSAHAPSPSPWPSGHFASSNQPDPNWLDHDRDRPQPAVVTPATPSTQTQPGEAPSDAIVLFDGKDLSQWSSMDGSPTKW